MYHHKLIGRVFLLGTAICVLVMGFVPAAMYAEDETGADPTEILNISVGAPTFLSPQRYQSDAAVAVSRTGTVAAFYPDESQDDQGTMYYRLSNDGGRTWGKQLVFPPGYAGPMSVGLREGGVLFMQRKSRHELEAKRIVFSDDFLQYEEGTSSVFLPGAVLNTKWAEFWPFFAKGKIIQLPDGDLLGSMYGNLEGDTQYRTLIARSTDGGQSWQHQASVAYSPEDPNPELPGGYCGYCEPSLALLSNGQLLCIMRTQGAQYASEYRPYYQCWSDDLGKTWTKPIPTEPHLMNISPTLAVLDNGVVACQFGRPGFHVAFSLDHGHSWQDRVSFADLPEPFITGQYDMVKVGPNSLVAIGSDAVGIRVRPITVERKKVAQSHVALVGQVLDADGNPIANATVQRSPSRYHLDAWLEHATDLDPWNATPLTIGSPVLGYRSIRSEHGHPTVQTDARGRFRFKHVEIGEYVLTVEADGYAPQSRNVKAQPESESKQFDLNPGRKVQGRVVDDTGQPVPGACVVLNLWHVHADDDGYFDWSLEGPSPENVEIRAYKRYDGRYQVFKGIAPFAQIESQPITIPRTK